MRRQANFEEQAKRNEDFYKMQEEINNDQSHQNSIINEANESSA